jgi:hypothetical protein
VILVVEGDWLHREYVTRCGLDAAVPIAVGDLVTGDPE